MLNGGRSGGHGQLGVHLAGQLVDEAEILSAQIEAERRVVVTGEDRRCVVSNNEAVADALLDGVPQRAELDTVADTDREAFTDRCRR